MSEFQLTLILGKQIRRLLALCDR